MENKFRGPVSIIILSNFFIVYDKECIQIEELNITEGLLETVSSSRLPNCRLQFPVQSHIPHSWQPLLLVYLGLFMKHSHYTGPGTQPLIMTSSTISFLDSFTFHTTGPTQLNSREYYERVNRKDPLIIALLYLYTYLIC